MKIVIFLMVQKSWLHAKHTWVICLWAVKLISSNFEEHISASYWCLPLSEGCQISRWAPLASTWDELSKLDQTLQLSCGTKFLERNQTLYCVTTTQRNFKYFRKSWNTATFSWNKKSKKSYSFSENKHCNFIGGQETQRNLKSLDEANRDKQMKP